MVSLQHQSELRFRVSVVQSVDLFSTLSLAIFYHFCFQRGCIFCRILNIDVLLAVTDDGFLVASHELVRSELSLFAELLEGLGAAR